MTLKIVFVPIVNAKDIGFEFEWRYLDGLNESITTFIDAWNYGSYGLIGVPSASNRPPVRTKPCAWSLNGKFYLFGGGFFAYDSLDMFFYSDVWEYELYGNFTWIGGTNSWSVLSSYNDSESNFLYPSSRRAAAYWNIDDAEYIFGGYGKHPTRPASTFNDIWLFNTTTRLFKCLSYCNMIGNIFDSTYGLVYNDNYDWKNIPSARSYMHFWKHKGIAYLLGGWGNSFNRSSEADVFGHLNDLWTFSPLYGFKYIAGPTTLNDEGHMDTIREYSSNNWPPALDGSSIWNDEDNEKVYKYGGVRTLDAFWIKSFYSDIWEYNLKTNLWRCLFTKPFNSLGYYGINRPNGFIPDGTHYPAARYRPMFWSYRGAFFLYAGWTSDGTIPYEQFHTDVSDDIWSWDPTTRYFGLNDGFQFYTTSSTAYLSHDDYTTRPFPKFEGTLWSFDNKILIYGGQGWREGEASMRSDMWLATITPIIDPFVEEELSLFSKLHFEYTYPLIIILPLTVLLILASYIWMNYFNSHGKKRRHEPIFFFASILNICDVTVDIAFGISLLSSRHNLSSYFIGWIIMLIIFISCIVNGLLSYRWVSKTIQHFHLREWMARHTIITFIASILSVLNIGILRLLHCNLFGISALSAPFDELERSELFFRAALSSSILDIPLFIIEIYYTFSNWDHLFSPPAPLIAAFLTTLFSLIWMAILMRVIALLIAGGGKSRLVLRKQERPNWGIFRTVYDKDKEVIPTIVTTTASSFSLLPNTVSTSGGTTNTSVKIPTSSPNRLNTQYTPQHHAIQLAGLVSPRTAKRAALQARYGNLLDIPLEGGSLATASRSASNSEYGDNITISSDNIEMKDN